MALLRPFNKQNRNAGTYTSPVVAVPQGLRSFSATALMDTADLIDVTLTMFWKIEASFEGVGGPFSLLVGGGWQGGLDNEGNPMSAPNQTWNSSRPVPTHVRAELTLSQRVSVGIDVDVT